MNTVTIYHNPRCTKSRQTLELLQENSIEPTVIEYLQFPPSAEELKHIIQLLGISPRDLLRKNEDEYKALGIDNEKLTDADVIKAMHEHPKLIERPIVVKGNRAAIGRPPEKVLEIL